MKITPIDEKRETEGVERDYYGVKLKIARAQNKQFAQAWRDETKGLHARGKDIDLNSKEAATATKRAMAKAILVGWNNFYIDGKEIEYSEDNAFALLDNDPDVLEFVSSISNDIDEYIVDDIEALRGKS